MRQSRILSAKGQPAQLPGVKERWKFMEPTLKKAPFLKIVPMLGSVGCPRFLLTKFKKTFHFLNNDLAINLKPKNYEWVDFYNKVIDLTAYTFSKKALYRRLMATPNFTSRWMNFMRAVSSEGYGRLRFYQQVRKNLIEDSAFRKYFEGETRQLPLFYRNIIQKDLGLWWQWLPQGALEHNPNAYLQKEQQKLPR